MLKIRPKVVVILGPNASGKSGLAVDLAREFDGEVISADSRQIYKGLDIGTGKVTKREMRGIKHHLLDVVSPKTTFSVARYQKLARRALEDILRRSKLPIICGGTGLYIDSLLHGWTLPQVPPNPELRRKLEKESAARLFTQLQKLDPRRAETIDRHNKRRLVRALEIVLETGKPVPVLQKESPYEILKIGIRWPEKVLKERIHKRLLARLRQGMVKEAERLHKQGLSWQRMEELGLEYRYLSRFLQNKISRQEMLAQLEKEIWRYAKRQVTWFKRDSKINWIRDAKEALRLVRPFLKKQ